jgi:CheY-like chemotaxis protein
MNHIYSNRTMPAKNNGILIVTQSSEEGHTIKKMLTGDMGESWCADTDEEGVKLFIEKRPTVLILSFEEISKAELFYLTLHRQCAQIQEIPHQSILLCSNKEAEAAFELCRKNIFDDYVVNRPLYDPFRILQSIHQALKMSSIRQASNDFRHQLADVGGDLRQLDVSIGKILVTDKELQHETLQAFKDFTKRMTDDLAQFETRLIETGLDNAVEIIDRTALQNQLNMLPHRNLEVKTLQVEKKMQDAQDQLKKSGKELVQQLGSIRNMEFPPVRPEVMVVDDESLFRELIIDILEESDFRATAAESGQLALNKLRIRPPNLILLDYQMPGLNGLDTLRKIKADSSLGNIPVIMLTGDSEKIIVRECIMAGAVDFIVKPSDRATLIEKIRSHLLLATKRNSIS